LTVAIGAWTVRQRWVVLTVLLALAGFLAFERFHEPVVISDPPGDGPRAAEVADKLDPNTAAAADLSSIPELGEKRAAEIVAYREDARRQHPGVVVFREPNDLLVIKGIGVGTVHNMERYLVFPPRKP
jgi:DNA uptake protein ComE-like DNA-binding protein